MSGLEEVAGELRVARAEGKDVTEIALLAKERLGAGFGVISFIASFRLAFDVPLPILQQAQAWQGFGWGEVNISDEEFSAVLSPWLGKS